MVLLLSLLFVSLFIFIFYFSLSTQLLIAICEVSFTLLSMQSYVFYWYVHKFRSSFSVFALSSQRCSVSSFSLSLFISEHMMFDVYCGKYHKIRQFCYLDLPYYLMTWATPHCKCVCACVQIFQSIFSINLLHTLFGFVVTFFYVSIRSYDFFFFFVIFIVVLFFFFTLRSYTSVFVQFLCRSLEYM